MDAVDGLSRLPGGPVRRMFAAARRHDLDAMVAEFADDYVNVTPNHPERSFTGSKQVRANWTNLFAGIPDLTPEIHDVAAGNDGTVWVEWGSRGTRRDGIPVELAGVAIITVRDGKIAAMRFYLEPVERGSGNVDAAVRATAGGDYPAVPRP